jgi:hypothetical protein
MTEAGRPFVRLVAAAFDALAERSEAALGSGATAAPNFSSDRFLLATAGALAYVARAKGELLVLDL